MNTMINYMILVINDCEYNLVDFIYGVMNCNKLNQWFLIKCKICGKYLKITKTNDIQY